MIEIRRATLDDYAEMAAMGREVGGLHHEAMPHLVTPDPMSEGTYRALLADSAMNVMLGVDQGEVVGYLIYKIEEIPESEYFYAQRNLYVQDFGIYRRHQRKGYGEALMNHAVEAARAQGIKRMTLRVWTFNEGAIAFYRRMGFTPETMKMTRDL